MFGAIFRVFLLIYQAPIHSYFGPRCFIVFPLFPQSLYLCFQMFLIHSFYQHQISLFLLCLKLFFLLNFFQSQMFRVGGHLETVAHRSSVPYFQILHFDPKGSLAVDFQDVFYKFLTSVVLLYILLLEEGHRREELLDVHGGGEMGGLLVDLDKVFAVEPVIEIELFTENHPFVKVHLVALLEKLAEHASVVVGLLAKSIESHLQVLVAEEIRVQSVVCFSFFRKEVGVSGLVLLSHLFSQVESRGHLLGRKHFAFLFYLWQFGSSVGRIAVFSNLSYLIFFHSLVSIILSLFNSILLTSPTLFLFLLSLSLNILLINFFNFLSYKQRMLIIVPLLDDPATFFFCIDGFLYYLSQRFIAFRIFFQSFLKVFYDLEMFSSQPLFYEVGGLKFIDGLFFSCKLVPKGLPELFRRGSFLSFPLFQILFIHLPNQQQILHCFQATLLKYIYAVETTIRVAPIFSCLCFGTVAF